MNLLPFDLETALREPETSDGSDPKIEVVE